MCGRARLSSDVSEIKIAFRIPPDRLSPNFPPSWNVAPTDSLPVVRYDRKAGQRSLDLLRWGLIPYWAKDIKVGFANINAKAEGIETRRAFRDAFERRRCLVPVDNFYEWKIQLGGKFGVGRSGGIRNATLISLTSEERRAWPHMLSRYGFQNSLLRVRLIWRALITVNVKDVTTHF